MAIKFLQLHKRSSYEYKFIQDKYSFSLDSKVYCLSDGATQSFCSEIWAELITKSFTKNPIFDPKKLIEELSISANTFKNFNFEFSSNPAKASLEKEKLKRGAAATFVGIKLYENRLSLISCGDSNVFIFRNNQLESFPFSNSDELDNNFHFLNTEKLLAGEVDESFFKTKDFKIEKSDIVILATDALSRLLLNNSDSFKHLIQTNDFETFKAFCLKFWDEKLMEEDDISAIIIKDFNSNDIIEIIPPNEFSFPKEVEMEFKPFTQIPSYLNEINDKDMHQILISINRINEDLNHFKKKSKFYEILLMLIISLITLNIFMLIYFKSEQPKSTLKEKQNAFNQELNQKKNIIKIQKDAIDELNKKLKSKTFNLNKTDGKIIVSKIQSNNKAKQKPDFAPTNKNELKDSSNKPNVILPKK
jgi:hypothetical protein